MKLSKYLFIIVFIYLIFRSIEMINVLSHAFNGDITLPSEIIEKSRLIIAFYIYRIIALIIVLYSKVSKYLPSKIAYLSYDWSLNQ